MINTINSRYLGIERVNSIKSISTRWHVSKFLEFDIMT